MKVLCKAFAFLSLGLGVVGMFLPVLPPTPFLLLSAYLFSKSSGRYYEWLLSHKWFGTYIRQFSEARSIPLRIKIVSISMLWTTILISLWGIDGILWLRLLLLLVAVGVTFHILSFDTRR